MQGLKPLQIVFLDRASLSLEISLRPPNCAHEWLDYPSTAPEQVAQRIGNADIVVVNKCAITKQDLLAAPRLKLIAVAATGTNAIDLSACQARGIAVCNIRGYALHSVPEHTFALIFALRRNICAYRDAVRAGRWQQAKQFCFFDYPIQDLAGSTLGVIGDGALGQAVAAMGRALQMRVLIAAHKGRSGQGRLYTPFEQTLAESDVITLHCPLKPETHNLIGLEEFQQMQRRPLLINTARGGLVDESLLGQALDAGWISGAAFDVVSTEPPPLEHPLMRLLERPNFILTPHIAWTSSEAMQALAEQLIRNIEAFVAGTPQNQVQA